MKGKAFIATILTASLIGTAPGMALAERRGDDRNDRDYRNERYEDHNRQQNRYEDHSRRQNRYEDHNRQQNRYDQHDRQPYRSNKDYRPAPPKHYREHERVRVGKHDYYYREGRFYRPGPRGWISVQAPIGAIVAGLPLGFSVMLSGGHTYFQFGTTFYSQVANGYMVVDSPSMAPAPIHGAAAFPGMVTVRPSLMNLRSGPGLNFAITGQVTAGHRLHVRGSSNGWYYVEQPNGNYGWAMINLTLPLH